MHQNVVSPYKPAYLRGPAYGGRGRNRIAVSSADCPEDGEGGPYAEHPARQAVLLSPD
jgi:hypothetical protein